MISFITKVLLDLQIQNVNFSDITFVLPSRRAGVFLRKELSSIINKTTFSPIIISIESFVEELSQLKSITNTELLFELYNTYTELTPKEEQVLGFWAQRLLSEKKGGVTEEQTKDPVFRKNYFKELFTGIKGLPNLIIWKPKLGMILKNLGVHGG